MPKRKKFAARDFLVGLLILSAGLIWSCAGTGGFLLPVEEIKELEIQGQDKFPDAGAVILLDERHHVIKIESGARIDVVSHITRHRVVKVLDEEGQRYGNVKIHLARGQRLGNITARTITADGTIVEVRKKDFFEVTDFPEYVLFAETKAVTFAFPAVEVGAILEYSYTIYDEDPLYWETWYFQHADPTLISRYSLTVPSVLFQYGWKWRSKTYNTSVRMQKKKLVAPRTRYGLFEWEERDIPAIRSEPNMPPWEDVARKIRFAPGWIKSWDDIAEVVDGEVKEQSSPTKEIQKTALSLVEGKSTPEEKVETIFYHIQDKFRYVAISLDESGITPHFVGDIFLNRYGDCKDLSTLLITMLRTVGIEAYPALVNTRGNGRVDRNFFSFQFNHMIVYALVQGKEYWLDPTANCCPVGELPWPDEDVEAMVIMEGKWKFLRTPKSRCQNNVTRRTLNVVLHSNGGIECQGRILYSGEESRKRKSTYIGLTEKERKESLQRFIAHWCPGAVLGDYAFSDLGEFDIPLSIALEFKAPAYADRSGDLMILRAGVLSRIESTAWFSSEEREYPIHLDFPEIERDSVIITLPSDYEVEDFPEDSFLNEDFGAYRTRLRGIGPSQIVYYRELIYKSTEIPVKQYPVVKWFFEEISKADRKAVILKKFKKM